MPPKSDKELVFFLVNVGKQPADGDPDFVKKAREIIKLITEKKIFLRPKDEVGVMLAGQEEFYAELNEPCTTLLQHNQVPTWEIVEKISKIEQTNVVFGAWPKALEEVVQHMTEHGPSCRLILILLMDCHSTCPGIKYVDKHSLADSLKALEVQVLWIGSKPLNDMEESEYNRSEKLLKETVQLANGIYMTIEKTLPTLRIFKTPKGRFLPWKCNLKIGNIAIPTTTYVQATEDIKRPSFKTVLATIEDGEEKLELVSGRRDYVDKHKETHNLENTIPGYMYGRKFIPVPDADAEGLKTGPNIKCFDIFGFVAWESVKLEDLGGRSVRIVLPDGESAEKPFYCLAKAMVDTDHVAIVRKVHQAIYDAKMGVLIPRIDVPHEPWCMVYVELLFVEDRRLVQSQPLNAAIKRLTLEKENAVMDLIESMMLTDDDETGELFVPGTLHSPGLQHLRNSLAYRALHPKDPVPPIQEHLCQLLEVPESIKMNSEAALQRLKELFPIEVTQKSSDDSNGPAAEGPSGTPSQTKSAGTTGEQESMILSDAEKSAADLDDLCFDIDV